MSNIKIEKVSTAENRALPVLAEVDRLMDRIRERAFELFADRGAGEGRALDDWLAAEREICWPAAELVESDKEFVLSEALAGFEPADITVTATPREIITKASRKSERKEAAAPGGGQVRWSEFRSDDVCRRVELPLAIEVDKVSASLHNGLLKVIAPKTKESVERAKPVEISIAA